MAKGASNSIGSFSDEPISRLAATTRGKMLLVNAYDLLQSRLLDPRKTLLALRGLRSVAGKLPDKYTDAQLIACLTQLRNPVASLFQACAKEPLHDDLTIAAVRTFEDIKAMLTEIQKVHQDDRRIRRALAPRAPLKEIQQAAATLNEYIPRMPSLALGIPYNLFWTTTIEAVASLERKPRTSDRLIANDVRDHLGLCHIYPDSRGRMPHLFLFEGLRPLKEMQIHAGFRVARPTLIDGFDNPRFRQLTSRCPKRVTGCGLTVDLCDGLFADGAAELVATKIPLKDNFRCRWIGNVSSMPPGTDEAFLDFISFGRSLSHIEHEVLVKSLRDVATELRKQECLN